MKEDYHAGVTIDRFTLECCIHRGNMSELWIASEPGATLPLVMKTPVLTRGYDPAAIVAFEVEQMILPTLAGPHVPKFVASGEFCERPYIVMEFVSGTSLRPRLDDAPLAPDDVARTGALVADALHDVHRQHVIHLDLKPSNIVFRSPATAALLDFGLARHDRLPDLLAEQFHVPLGTAPYMAPEQVVHVRNDLRSDIFALGVILYHLVTGARPYGNPSSVLGLRRRLYRDPAPPRAVNQSVPAWLQEIILRCLEVVPSDRYDTAAQVALDLRNPEQVKLTPRAERNSRDRLSKVARRWLRAVMSDSDAQQSTRDDLLKAPIVMVALDLTHGGERLLELLRDSVLRILTTDAKARLACVTVIKIPRIGMNVEMDDVGRNIQMTRLIELKHWWRTLQVPDNHVTFHVLQAPDPASAIVQFARSNHVDQIIIGARGSSPLRRYLGSVSSQVVAEAPCSVTVVRLPQHAERRSQARDVQQSTPEDIARRTQAEGPE